MVRRLSAAALALLLSPGPALAQQPLPPFPTPPPPGFELRPSPFAPVPVAEPPPAAGAPVRIEPVSPEPRAPATVSPDPPEAARVFCEQSVPVRLAERDAVPERYRRFVGIWSDAAWNPQLCAALIVESVAQDGTATIIYAFGPMGANARAAGGVLHGTGIIREGELRFQNSDGSQFAFRPLYSDLEGSLTTPQGQTYQAVFKKAL